MHLGLRSVLALLYLSAALCAGVPAVASQKTGATEPDNTRANRGDNGKPQNTADQGSGTKSDRELTREIRKAVVEDKSLSTNGKNVKILVSHGKVTLKGPVKSDEEKKTVEQYATKAAGDGNVDNELSIRGARGAK